MSDQKTKVDKEVASILKEELREELRRVTQCWESDKAIFRGALQLLKEAGLTPSSTELIAAAKRFDTQND